MSGESIDVGDIGEISVQDLATLGEAATVVDVREPVEWDDGHIPWARLVPVASVPDHLDAFDATPTYVVCRSGGRSARACEYVAAQGGRVVNVVGGMLAWQEAGLEIATGPAAGASGA
jgi:rhodanese-related sulfurtransferase